MRHTPACFIGGFGGMHPQGNFLKMNTQKVSQIKISFIDVILKCIATQSTV